MAYPFQLRGVYSFDVYPVAVITNAFQAVTISGLLDYESAKLEAPIDELHANVYPMLPSGTPNDPTLYDYVRVKLQSGQSTVLGMPWINENTITSISSLTATCKVAVTSLADRARLSNMFNQNGFTSFTIDIG